MDGTRFQFIFMQDPVDKAKRNDVDVPKEITRLLIKVKKEHRSLIVLLDFKKSI